MDHPTSDPLSAASLALLAAVVEFAPASVYSRCQLCAVLVPRQHTAQHAAFHDALAVAVGASS